MILICLLLAPCGKEITLFLFYQKEIPQTVCRDSVATKESVLSVVSVCPYSSGISGTLYIFKKWRFFFFLIGKAAYYVFQEMAFKQGLSSFVSKMALFYKVWKMAL